MLGKEFVQPSDCLLFEMRPRIRTELICLGNELLNGVRPNAHLPFIGGELLRSGLELARCVEVGDSPSEIGRAFLAAWERADLVITTGGLGPTSDDLTRETIADVLRRRLVRNEEAIAQLEVFFAQRGLQPTENNYRQCNIIEGAEVLPNPNGTAPGQWFEDGRRVLAMLPGPPHELNPMLEKEVIPRLIAKGWAQEDDRVVEFRTAGLGESLLEDWLQPIFRPFESELSVAYCAHPGMVDVRLSPVGDSVTRDFIREIAARCREKVGEAFVGLGRPRLACVVNQQLRAMGKTFAVAESCTGGLLASHFTDIPGASKVFAGGMVCYRNEAKINLLDIPDSLLVQHGAVSAECAVAMATAVAERFEADYALSITGYAGPDGGREPVGTIYLGYHSPVGVWSRKVVFPGSRVYIKQRAVNMALDFMRRKLQKYAVHDLLESLRC